MAIEICGISKRDKNTSNNLSMESHSNCARAIEMSTHGPHSNQTKDPKSLGKRERVQLPYKTLSLSLYD